MHIFKTHFSYDILILILKCYFIGCVNNWNAIIVLIYYINYLYKMKAGSIVNVILNVCKQIK